MSRIKMTATVTAHFAKAVPYIGQSISAPDRGNPKAPEKRINHTERGAAGTRPLPAAETLRMDIETENRMKDGMKIDETGRE